MENIKLYSTSNEQMSDAGKRQKAVEAALDVISAEVSSSGNGSGNLRLHMENLSLYADQIQAALRNENN